MATPARIITRTLHQKTPQKVRELLRVKVQPPLPARSPSLFIAQPAVWPDQAAPWAAPARPLADFVHLLCNLRPIHFQISPDYFPSHKFGYKRQQAAIWRIIFGYHNSLHSNPNHLLHPSHLSSESKARRIEELGRTLRSLQGRTEA